MLAAKTKRLNYMKMTSETEYEPVTPQTVAATIRDIWGARAEGETARVTVVSGTRKWKRDDLLTAEPFPEAVEGLLVKRAVKTESGFRQDWVLETF